MELKEETIADLRMMIKYFKELEEVTTNDSRKENYIKKGEDVKQLCKFFSILT